MSQWQQYSNLIQALGIPDSVRCICVVGAGGVFCIVLLKSTGRGAERFS